MAEIALKSDLKFDIATTILVNHCPIAIKVW